MKGVLLRRKILITRQTVDKGCQQIGGAADIVQGDGLYGAVHVAVGDADQPGGHTCARKLDDISVGGSAAAMGGYLVWDVCCELYTVAGRMGETVQRSVDPLPYPDRGRLKRFTLPLCL
jgi:hypothetical protein